LARLYAVPHKPNPSAHILRRPWGSDFGAYSNLIEPKGYGFRGGSLGCHFRHYSMGIGEEQDLDQRVVGTVLPNDPKPHVFSRTFLDDNAVDQDSNKLFAIPRICCWCVKELVNIGADLSELVEFAGAKGESRGGHVFLSLTAEQLTALLLLTLF
jgi:hypothetical protein